MTVAALAATVAIGASGMTQEPVAVLSRVAHTEFLARTVAQGMPGSDTKVSLVLKNLPVPAALDSLAAVSGIRITYSKSIIPVGRRISVDVANCTVQDVLRQILAGTGTEARATLDRQIVIARSRQGQVEKDGIITGRVIHATTKQPVSGATVTVGNGQKKVVTGNDGRFQISVTAGDETTLQVRAVGFVRQSKSVTVSEGSATAVEIVLEPSASVLDEVVVTGTVVATERKAIPNPITVITAEDIEQRGITRIEQLLRGEVPGVFAADEGTSAYEASFGDGASIRTKVYARGASNIGPSGAPTPLKTYIDGVEILDPSYLGTIDPKSIDRIEIVTGPQAATVYGSGAMGGVMQVFTRKGAGAMYDAIIALRYGVLESNVSEGLTATHNDAINLTGGSGVDFSYAASASYIYSGQWQPDLFSRRYSLSVGVTHTHGKLTATGSASASRSMNGLTESGRGVLARVRTMSGEWWNYGGIARSPRRSQTGSQTTALNVDWRQTHWIQHHITLGSSQTTMGLIPRGVRYTRPSDSLPDMSTRSGGRTTVGVNSTLGPPALGIISNTLTVGITGSRAEQTSIRGCLSSLSASAFRDCPGSSYLAATRTVNESSYGGFARWQLGVANSWYLTLGVRGERNPNYGQDHKIDWTPSNGITYVAEVKDLTIKLLASYGRATRAPRAEDRLEVIHANPAYDPGFFTYQFANLDLRPEYSRGPQGGIELYYGNLGSISVNRYVQNVTDLIQGVVVDSAVMFHIVRNDTVHLQQWMYQNVASVHQHGWEVTGTTSLMMFTIRGVYSWTDSRVRTVPPGSPYRVGQSFGDIPTHLAHLVVGYAHGGTTVSLTANYRGAMITGYSTSDVLTNLAFNNDASRLRQYIARVKTSFGEESWQPGYVKSDLSLSHQLSSSLSLTANVVNLGNSQGSESTYALSPSLGRQSTFGVTLRFR